MEGIGFSGGFQLPMQRRLSRLYNDTKKSSNFVKEPIQHAEDPEVKSLHRKLRIQKDRFTSWGLEWSDPNQSAEIDTSLSKAGVSEIVGSILSTIKDCLVELDALWKAYEKQNGSRSEKSDLKTPFVVWDKARFADYIADLTQSIDTLYDLSRTRASPAMTSGSRSRLQRPLAGVDENKAFESTRMQTPQQIDPSTLTDIRSQQAEPLTGSGDNKPPRDIVFMSKQAWTDLAQHIGRQPFAPLLLEFATFDSIYSITGIMPPMSRFEKLSSGLQQDSRRAPGAWIGLPRLLGYFEDLEHSRLGLVYQFPPSFNAVSFENFTQNPIYNICTLGDLLSRPDYEPALEAKFRLAHNLCNTVFDLHARGITHGSLIDKNISFCNTATPDLTTGVSEVDVRRPMISSFDLFPDAPSDQEPPSPSTPLFRHPLDPRTTPSSPITDKTDSRILDLYSLAMILLSVGLWTKLENLVSDPSQPISEAVIDQLSIRCGTHYMKAVKACWSAVDQGLQGKVAGEELLSNVQVKASRYLEACCILDGLSALDERLSLDLGERTVSPVEESPKESISGPSRDTKTASQAPPDTRRRTYDIKTPIPDPTPSRSYPSAEEEKRQLAKKDAEEAAATPTEQPVDPKPAKSPSPKTRLYPQIPLPADAIEKWNSTVMPQVNQALRHFYRKHSLESVEISLESIGSSPKETQPTVLVVCTSVSKVKSILTRKLGQLFDGTSGFGLKVCKGQVLRSRKDSGEEKVKRSAADDEDDDEVEAANTEYQVCPSNGASIGAWIGDRHLPPVSLGGLVVVDDKPYGMTVHHMLDDQVEIAKNARELEPTYRSMAKPTDDVKVNWYTESSAESSGGEDFACEFSDSDSEAYSETDITSEGSDEDESDGEFDQPGDIPGVEPDCGDGYIITQPARDDVEENFFASDETADEEHLETFTVGVMYASSGLRRREQNGLIHEIDWALFEFADERQPDENAIPRIRTQPSSLLTGKRPSHEASDIHPTTVVPTSSLPGTEVICMARTSGLQTGLILPALTSVKISGRITPSHTYQVSSAAAETPVELSGGNKKLAMGVPGDSGAWVVERAHGRVCGHILAWSGRKRVAYICPMEILLLDIAETLEARTVGLPGGEAIVESRVESREAEDYGGDTEEPPSSPFLDPRDDDDYVSEAMEEDDDAPVLVQTPEEEGGEQTKQKQHGGEKYASDDSNELSRRMESMGIGRSRMGIGMCS
ncbi:het-s domain protein [Colletotrichum karsti]|uniref:Het-s domain protein n=1 Tax=Colletotrichum karsti TaxID=1095194 RepID=A0A9P6LGL6_9PEZI|nr:het-s domain protein [Colletotrichum karsti]KAF9875354.1 het-s domain protein [Colletotrichum karsti]